MIKAILLCVVGTALCQFGGGDGLPGGWHDFHGDMPDAVTAAVKQTLEAENHMQLGDLTYSNVRQQVVAGFNYAFDVSFTGHGGQGLFIFCDVEGEVLIPGLKHRLALRRELSKT